MARKNAAAAAATVDPRDALRTLEDLVRWIGCDPSSCAGSHGGSGPIGWRSAGDSDGRYELQHFGRTIRLELVNRAHGIELRAELTSAAYRRLHEAAHLGQTTFGW